MQTKVLKNSLVVLIPIAILILVTTLSLMPPDDLPKVKNWFKDIPYIDKFVHFCFYFALTTTVRFAKTYFTGFPKACAWKLLVMAAVYGGAIELLQEAYFGRGCELWDEAANITGAVVGIWVIPQKWHNRLADRLKKSR